MDVIHDNIKNVQGNIDEAARHAGRDPENIHLIAVSKKQPIARIHGALAAGHRLYGENRVQEAQERWLPLKLDYPDLVLHLIGPLQTNKVKDAVALFDCIQTIDRPKLARALHKELEKQGRTLSFFIQVNTGEEDQKAGVSVQDFEALYRLCTEELGLNIKGLMCIPPIDEPPALHFGLLTQMARDYGLKDLSMGMSADFEKAIPLGATYIRVGTGVFGERPAMKTEA